MIKVKVNRGKVDIEEMEGNGVNLMSEACCIVKAICTAFCEDETDKESMTKDMIFTIAKTLMLVEFEK